MKYDNLGRYVEHIDKPDSRAITDELGDTYYYNNNISNYQELHRENGPAVVLSGGYKAWYIHGKLHRTDGPAVIYRDGSTEYWVNGKRHRIDGPAIETKTGVGRTELDNRYWINGVRLTEEEFLERQTNEKT